MKKGKTADHLGLTTFARDAPSGLMSPLGDGRLTTVAGDKVEDGVSSGDPPPDLIVAPITNTSRRIRALC